MIPKITSANLCKPIHDITKYSTSICPFESGKCGKERKTTKISITWERKGLSRWNKKTCFIVFKGLSFGEKWKLGKK